MGLRRLVVRTLLLGVALLAVGVAPAFASLSWSGPEDVGGDGPMYSASCLSASLCIFTNGGDLVASTNPTGGTADWSEPAPIEDFTTLGVQSYLGLSCATSPSVMCVAIDNGPNLATSADPTATDNGQAADWTLDSPTDPTGPPTFWGVSCPSSSLCVAAGYAGATLVNNVGYAGAIYYSTTPNAGANAWHGVDFQNYQMYSVACGSPSFCVAGESTSSNNSLNLASTTNPTGAATAWSQHTISTGTQEAGAYVTSLSCPSMTLCAGTDSGGGVITSSSPTTGGWTFTDLSSVDPNEITNVSCTQTPSTLCVAVDDMGDVISSTDPTGGATAWTMDNIDGTNQMAGVFCESASLCLVGDGQGDVLTMPPAPTGPTTSTLTVRLSGSGSGTVTSSPAGISCGKTCSKSFANGTKLTLNAAPGSGSKFAGWSGGCSGTGACTITLSAATKITASFNKGSSGAKPSHTKITKAKINAKKHSASFSFTAVDATSYQCALIAPAKKGHKPGAPKFGSCHSPRSYARLKGGKYTFEVRGISSKGSDPTLAKKSFRIK